MTKISRRDDFVRCVIAKKDRVSSEILYTDRQIQELKSFCVNRPDGSVLGFDKTYNLGAMFVTPSVYKNSAVQTIVQYLLGRCSSTDTPM